MVLGVGGNVALLVRKHIGGLNRFTSHLARVAKRVDFARREDCPGADALVEVDLPMDRKIRAVS